VNGDAVGSMRGLSLRPILEGRPREPHSGLHFTFYGKNNALLQGDWKLVNRNFGPWELYNLIEDRTELNNLGAARPDRLSEMTATWEKLAAEIGVARRRR
jgi:arylsulfatase